MIPMDFYRQLNNITDISEFIEKFIDPNSIDPKIGLQGMHRSKSIIIDNLLKMFNCFSFFSFYNL